MKKILLIILIVGAVGIYTYDAMLLIGASHKEVKPPREKGSITLVSIDKLVADAKPVEFAIKGRNPFTPRKIEPRPPPVVSSSKPGPAPAAKPAQKDLPAITISGIMWNSSAPIAMLILPGGSSVVAKPGEVFGDITIRKIEKNRIQIMHKNREFWINQ